MASRLRVLALLALASCSAPAASRPAPPEGGRARPLRPLRPDTLEQNGWDRDCDLLAVVLDVAIDFPDRSLAGRVEHRLRALTDGTRVVRVHAAGLTLEDVEDGEGRALSWEQDGSLVRIDLGRELSRGEEARVAIRYRARPAKGLYFRESSKDAEGFAPQVFSQGQAEDTRYWIPVWDYPNDRATFEARITVGEGMTALSNGTLISVEPPEGEVRTFHWRLDQRQPTYLIALAAGRWERYLDQAGDVPLEYWVAPGTGESKARRAFGETPAMMAYFEELLDEPFPYPRYGQVAVSDFLYAGMENTTLTVVDDYVIAGPEAFADLGDEPRLLVAHELAHQWFGDLVTCLGWSHLWLNEAWASYLEVLWARQVEGPDAAALLLESYRESYLARGDLTRRPLSEDWRTQLTRERCTHEYDKGPWVLHMLEHEMGAGAFWQGVRDYLDRHRDGLVTTADFGRALFDSTGRNVEGFLEQWVQGGGHPVLRVRFDELRARRGRGPLRVRIDQVQRTDELVPLFDVPLDLDLVYTSGERQRVTVRVSEARSELHLPITGPLADFQVDPDGELLCELDLAKPLDMWVRQAGDDSPVARWRAVVPLARAAPAAEEARKALLEMLARDPQPRLRARAASRLRFRAARPALALALGKDPSPGVRLQAAWSLAARTPNAAEAEILSALAARESSPAVRAALERSLAAREERSR